MQNEKFGNMIEIKDKFLILYEVSDSSLSLKIPTRIIIAFSLNIEIEDRKSVV